jgi:hypothetical protein
MGTRRQLHYIVPGSSRGAATGSGPGEDRMTFLHPDDSGKRVPFRISPLVRMPDEQCRCVTCSTPAGRLFDQIPDSLRFLEKWLKKWEESDDSGAVAGIEKILGSAFRHTGQPTSFICRPVKWITNGFFQQILWLGVAGYAIVNHYQKEILLVDPWPTYHYDGPLTEEGSLGENIVDLAQIVPSIIIAGVEQDLTYAVTEDGVMKTLRKDAIARLQALANFLRTGVAEGYQVTGILHGHHHFDHTFDSHMLLELLHMEAGTHRNRFGVEFQLHHPPLEIDPDDPRKRLPKIYADWESMGYVQDLMRWEPDIPSYESTDRWRAVRDAYVEGDRFWHEIQAEDGVHLHYDDDYNVQSQSPQAVGVPCRDFDVGHFRVKPYVWDHGNTKTGRNVVTVERAWFRRADASDPNWHPFYPLRERLGSSAMINDTWWLEKEGTTGNLQRQSAFLIYHNDVSSPKRTFINGSAGEMSDEFTSKLGEEGDVSEPLVRQLRETEGGKLEVDLFINAVAGSSVLGMGAWPLPPLLKPVRQMKGAITYQQENIEVRDFHVMSHFCDFLRIAGWASDTSELLQHGTFGCFGRVEDFLKALAVTKTRGSPGIDLVKKTFVLGRAGFEYDYPHSPVEMRRWLAEEDPRMLGLWDQVAGPLDVEGTVEEYKDLFSDDRDGREEDG